MYACVTLDRTIGCFLFVDRIHLDGAQRKGGKKVHHINEHIEKKKLKKVSSFFVVNNRKKKKKVSKCQMRLKVSTIKTFKSDTYMFSCYYYW